MVLANRSACFLKLGDHGRALEDAPAAAGFDDTYAKAHFRRGLAVLSLLERLVARELLALRVGGLLLGDGRCGRPFPLELPQGRSY